MQQSIAAAQRSSTPESEFVGAGQLLLSRVRSMATALIGTAASALFRIFERFDSGMPDSIDIDRVAAHLRVAQRAASDGRIGYPPSGEESISGTQLEIVAHFRELQRKAQRRIGMLADKPRKMREKIDLAGTEGAIRDIPSRCENDVLRMLAEWQSRLSSFGNEAVERPHNPSRGHKAESAAPEQSIPVVLQLAFLAALVGVGAILVGSTPAFETGVGSPVPPVWTFVILAGVVILSSVAGRAVSSSISHDGRLWRLRKWLRGGIGVVFAGLTAVSASHYLLALAGARDIGLSAAVDGLSMLFSQLVVERTGPLLTTGDWTVLAVVLAAALAAFVVCYRPDSEAPRHEGSRPGHRTRRGRALLIRQLRKVNKKVDQAEADVTANLKRAKAALGKYARLVDASRRLPAKQSDYDYALENACNLLLDRYRAENIRARTTEAPHSFQEHVCFRTEGEGGPAASAGEEHHLEALQQGLRKLESQAGQIRQELRALNSRAIHTLEESARQA